MCVGAFTPTICWWVMWSAPRTIRKLTCWDSGTIRPLRRMEHPAVNPGANLKSISHRCYLREASFEWELTKETIYLPLGCLQGGAHVDDLLASHEIRAAELVHDLVRAPQPLPHPDRHVPLRGGRRSSIPFIIFDFALEATQGQIQGFVSQLPYKCHLEEVASVGD